ncbi:hypothetical protein [Mycolicibacterium septicum]|uniref:hypothetical protein n=1 Tax=Mycolicibacterium septicum TaxID=98668 RepID=UPI001AF75096|nr:hypothetical protein [Mycolicibacterium septicum]QRY51842.1 hypothetical protein JVX95_31460 [Mycolicibacterium septicum]
MNRQTGRLDLQGRPWKVYAPAELLKRPFENAAEEFELCGVTKSEWYEGKRRKDADDFPNAEELRIAADKLGASLFDMLVDFGMAPPTEDNPGYLAGGPAQTGSENPTSLATRRGVRRPLAMLRTREARPDAPPM